MKKISALVCILLLCVSMCSCSKGTGEPFQAYSFDYFDTVTTVVGYADSKKEFDEVCSQIWKQLEEYHRLYDIYTYYDGLNNLAVVNQAADAVQVDRRILDLLHFGQEMYEQTGGRVNIAMGSVLAVWHEYRAAGQELPPVERLQQAAEHTDISDLAIDDAQGTVRRKDLKLRLDVGAIAKGYAAEMAARYLEQRGISGYLLNLGGNVRAVGCPPGDPWKIGIEDPEGKKPYLRRVNIAEEAVVTSGSYQRYYTVAGKDYHHIIDRDTLFPAEYFRSVSVICRNSALGDALSTAFFLMPQEEGLAMAEGFADVEVMWVLKDGTQLFSSGFHLYEK